MPSKAAPNSRPVHPCYLSVFEGTSGAEYATWAKITPGGKLPDLVTAQVSTLTVYAMEESSGKLLEKYKFPTLAGNVCYLDTLQTPDGQPDALLVGFVGHPRLSICTVTNDRLLATSLIDLTPALQESCYGAMTPWEQDLQANLLQSSPNLATLCVILGGGCAVACLELVYHNSAWTSQEPYLLPLQKLSNPETTASSSSTAAQSIVTGFGDVLSVTFLPGYLEPTLVLLHSHPDVGTIWSGRLGRHEGGTRNSLVLTAITVTVTHERSAVLWETEVPADAIKAYAAGHQGCLVQCVNSIISVNNTGQVQQCLAVNGWASSTLSVPLQAICQTNPWPFPPLAVSLDGAVFSFLNETTAFITLRCGQVYLLQHHTNAWSMLPLYNTVGAIGQVSNMICWPLGNVAPAAIDAKLWDKEKTTATKGGTGMEMGLLFVGSRMGDSSLLGYALEPTSVADALKQEPGLLKAQNGQGGNVATPTNAEYNRILQLEEEALYAPTGDEDAVGLVPAIIPPSDDEESMEQSSTSRRKRARLSQLTVVRSLTVMDSLTALGPLGPGCTGPLSKPPESKSDNGTTAIGFGSTGYIFPCGYGTSGGLALLTVPGGDDRTILAENDCINVKALFNLPSRGIVLLSLAEGGIRLLKLDKASSDIKTTESIESADQVLIEVDMTEWATEEARDLLGHCHLLAVGERDDDSFSLVIGTLVDENIMSYSLLVLRDASGKLEVLGNDPLPVPAGDFVLTVAPATEYETGQISFAYTLSSGDAQLITMDASGALLEFGFAADIPMDSDEKELSEEEQYYAIGNVMALDIFKAPKSFFPLHSTDAASSANNNGQEAKKNAADDVDFFLDDDDKELYGKTGKDKDNTEQTSSAEVETQICVEEVWYVALCRQSGSLEVYAVADLVPGQQTTPLWKISGCGHGVPELKAKHEDGSAFRAPRMHKVHAQEIRFFFCGPGASRWEKSLAGPRPFCLTVETGLGDTFLYAAEIDERAMNLTTFRRVPLKSPTRPSQEQSKHFTKLRRKGIVSNKDAVESPTTFRHNRLHRFQKLSGQDGLFAAVARPFWLVAERGRPTMLCHRSRHVAPAGARPRPVAGFCSGLLNTTSGEPGFMTLHERVGRVGSQRLTVFSGILNLASAHGLLPGGGFFVEKIPLGVTVRRIQFIDDPNAGSRPMYAVLVSRELEADQSELNDDGFSSEQRQGLADEKENAKIKRQVEADLGGFDIEQEWVEEIERENCFKVDTKLGGAPPIQKSAYSLWIVDAASGWDVVDSYEFEDFEHAMTMQVMSLSEFTAEPGSSNTETISEDDMGTRLFITIGTGIVDKDGEDVSSKGRIILLELNRSAVSQAAELAFVYEKKIMHGPVTSLSCLSSEGKNRLVIGAGADINIEQWGNDKLNQVGFFRATMHILDIKLFKNFFVLSDAYDSLYFLVWRESDKSLTMLAKDYDPIPVYAAGLLSRGGSLDLICHDDRQNLQFFQYAPGDAAARGGNKLVCRADFHLGSQTIDLQNHFCRSSLLINSATPTSTLAALQQQDTFFGRTDDDQRLGVHFGTTDGGYGTIIPLSEQVYWRLTALQSVMVNALESDCALSQRAWRLYRRTARRGGCRNNDRKKGVIDGDLVIQYADLALADQEDLASAIGSTVELILDNLLELRCSSMVI